MTKVLAKSAPKKDTKKSIKKDSPVKETATKESKSSSRKETLKISVRAFEHKMVDEAVKKIVSAAKDTGSQTV
jgi:hypothetical protein